MPPGDCPAAGGGGGSSGFGAGATNTAEFLDSTGVPLVQISYADPPVADTAPPAASAKAKRTQDIDKLALTLTSGEAASVTGRATINVPAVQKRAVRSKPARSEVAAGSSTRLRFKFAKKTLRRIKAALGNGARLSAKISVTVTDAAGNATTVTKTVKLRD
jgi:hypothetical protein